MPDPFKRNCLLKEAIATVAMALGLATECEENLLIIIINSALGY
jgi:hypothetical protein